MEVQNDRIYLFEHDPDCWPAYHHKTFIKALEQKTTETSKDMVQMTCHVWN